MANNFQVDLRPLQRLIVQSAEAAGQGAKQALDDIKDDWVREARDVAPLDTTNLRRQIKGKVKNAGLDGEVIVTANAKSKSNGKSFNYAYYIHEGHMSDDGKKLRHPGTVEEFLNESADESKWQGWLEDEIKDALRREGW